MKRLIKALVKFMVVSAVLAGLGHILARRMTQGDEHADRFTLAAFFGGAQRASTATALRHGRVVVAFGGVDLDLRGATPDAAGAELAVEAYMGGIQVTVPENWRVTVDWDAAAAGVESRVTPPENLPDDAFRLHVSARARMSGVLVTTGS